MTMLRSAIVIPTYNGGTLWEKSANNIKEFYNGRVVIVDSGSKDQTVSLAKKLGFDVYRIPNTEFNHGGTRNYGVNLVQDDCDIVIFLTQDAILQDPQAIAKMVDLFEKEPELAAAYGRQLPHDDANPVASHARLFNYSENGYVISKEMSKTLGIKSVFLSNSFSAYRVSAFRNIGGFASNTILCEDMLFAANALNMDYKVGYNPEAKAKHSHNYSPVEEFKRYFDIGVFHFEQPWIGTQFGGTKNEGWKFLKSEFSFLMKHAPLYIPLALMNNVAKISGYKLGKKYKVLPGWLVYKLSMHKRYWK